jgi:deoxyribodipyrimidine photo-lyase
VTAALCWFRRNLRLDDNATLAAALRHADAAVPVFVLDDFDRTHDFSPPRLAVLAGSLRELETALREKGSRLVVREGPAGEALATLCRETGAAAVFAHRDHEPHAKELHAGAGTALSAIGAKLHLVEDLHLVPAGGVATGDGMPYTVFTPFSKRWLERDKEPPVREPAAVPTPEAVLAPAFSSIPLAKAIDLRETGAPRNPEGGARAARRLWDAFRAGALVRYAGGRDRPDLPGTSRLSPHLRFGTLGVRRLLAEAREVWMGASPSGKASVETFVKELAWREFHAGILESFPRAAAENFRREFDRFPWTSGTGAEERFASWSAGRTGIPIVDAGMRQLLAEGWMHNRVRMVVASFLTKDLLVDWRRGEAFFRRHLADGDLASNAGGWQWAAGSGTDAQPFFRIFNPVLQGRRFDPGGAYVRTWVPELAGVKTPEPAAIHAPWLLPSPPVEYPAPIVDHAAARKVALDAFAAIRA